MIIREEQPTDIPAIRAIHDAAFGGTAEARLVDRLRQSEDLLISLIAIEDGALVGHILFSKLPIELTDGTVLKGAALAPMAVLPSQQRRGISSVLVRESIAKCRLLGIQVIAVLGHPTYYPRFGFTARSGKAIDCKYTCENFMALELESGILHGVRGKARYAPAFSDFD
ncbi:MAG: N-acetyltransferase [Acidobacteria bacterium]|nr:N-acetyltransferase [Acidobacteriota bacterium]